MRTNNSKEKVRQLQNKQLGLMIKQKFSLHYDFGDDWMFTITVQNITETLEKTAPKVIKEKGEMEQYPDWEEDEYDYE